MDYNHRQSSTGVNSKQDTYPDFHYGEQQLIRCVSPLETSSGQHFMDLNPEYDEIDLLSECSTPVTYVPGRYLQLCDINAAMDMDTKLWPVSTGTSGDMTTLIPGATRQEVEEGYVYSQTYRKTPGGLRQSSSKLVVTIAVCMVVALAALGGLATFV